MGSSRDNSIIRAEDFHIPYLVDFITLNISKTLPMLQGFDGDGSSYADGYRFYFYGRELNGGIFVDGAISVSPGNVMTLFAKDDDMFLRLDFYRLLRHISPRTVRVESRCARRLEMLLESLRIRYDSDAVSLMMRSGVMTESSMESPPAVLGDKDRCSKDDVISLVNEAQREFGKGSLSKSEILGSIIPRVESGDFIVAIEPGTDRPAAQGSIEFKVRGAALIGGIYTRYDFRRMGYGSFVVSELAKRARESHSIPFLFVERSNMKAIGLYESLNFSDVAAWCHIRIYMT